MTEELPLVQITEKDLLEIELPAMENLEDEQRIQEIIDASSQIIPEPRSLIRDVRSQMKTLDIYGGTPMENMIASMGARKTIRILRKDKNLYGMTSDQWRKTKRDFRRAKLSVAKSQREIMKENITTLNEVMVDLSEDWAKERSQHWDEKLNNEKGFFNKLDSNLNSFDETEKERIKKRIEYINNIKSPKELEEKIAEWFVKKVSSKKKPEFVKKLEDLMKPVEEEILPWYEQLMILNDMASSLSIDTVVNVVKNVVLMQYYPFIAKYKQYKTTIQRLKNLAIEETLILEAIRNKAQQYGDEVGIIVPPLPAIPTLPDLPDLPI